MVNLTWFKLAEISSVSIGQLLDFFESAPRLREVKLRYSITTPGTINGRLVSLACLKRIKICGGPPSALLNHLLVPVGAELITKETLSGPLIEDHLPRSLDNLKNFPNFTMIELYADGPFPYLRFSGPNGQVKMIARVITSCGTSLLLETLADLDTSKTERLQIYFSASRIQGSPHQALLPMKELRTLKLYHCASPRIFVRVLHPSANLSEAVVCPELEELIIEHRTAFDIEAVVGMAAARASRGVKLETVRIVHWHRSGYTQPNVSELKKHVSHVECNGQWDDDVWVCVYNS